MKNSTELTLSYYVLFYLGEKRHATNSMVFLTDLRAPAHPVQKWPNVSPTTAGINKPSWIPRISVVVHFQSLGVTCVWSDMRACPSISQVRKSSKRLFPRSWLSLTYGGWAFAQPKLQPHFSPSSLKVGRRRWGRGPRGPFSVLRSTVLRIRLRSALRISIPWSSPSRC